MSGHGEKMSRNKDKAVAALISHPSIPAAAKAVGVGASTLSRWLRDEKFNSAYRQARRQVVAQAMAKIQGAMASAVNTLGEVMGDINAPASARVAAARNILDLGIRAVEMEDFEERLNNLEEIIERQNQ
jgi:hypothetical protein